MAWIVDDFKLGVDVANGLTNEPISKNIPVRGGNTPIVVDIKVASGTGTIKVQDSSDGFTTSNLKSKTVAVAGAGTYSITFLAELAGDQADYPMRNAIRIVMDTTSAVVLEEVRVVSER